MIRLNCWLLGVMVSPCLVQIGICANPSIKYVELTDSSTHAGNRKSRGTLLCVKRDGGISLNAVAGIDDDNGTQPTWSASVGSITGNGASASWSGTDSSSITASLSGKDVSADLSVSPENKRNFKLFDKDQATVKKTIDDFNSLISKLGYKQGLVASGSVELDISNVDYYNDGEKLGVKAAATGTVTASLGNLSVDIEIPTTVAAIKVIGSASLDLQEVSVSATGAFDESKQNPWGLTGQLSWKAGVSASAGIAVGLPAGANLLTISATGSSFVKITGDVKGKDRNVVISGNVEAKALEVTGKVTWELGFKEDLAVGTKVFGEPKNIPIEETVVYSLPSAS
jgi:hypothetical protein